ncbi:MAG: hypothetical protein ACI8XC_004491, partial [Gammaproteobacteria bacterium]
FCDLFMIVVPNCHEILTGIQSVRPVPVEFFYSYRANLLGVRLDFGIFLDNGLKNDAKSRD